MLSYSAVRPNSFVHPDLSYTPATLKCPALRSGQPVYITCGTVVERATFLHYRYGRCTVALGEGGITINRSRVFLTEHEAWEHIPAASMARMKHLQAACEQLSEHEIHDHSNFIRGMEEPYEHEMDSGYSPVSDHRDQAWRYNSIDTPGDGWGRASRNGRW